MRRNLDAGSQVEVNKQFTGQEQREDATAKVDVRNHSFDWRDLLLIAMPIATIAVAMFWEAE